MTQKRFAHSHEPVPTQRVFQWENRLLASLEVAEAERIKRVWQQAYYHPFGSKMPMLPTRPPQGWRQTPPEERAHMQTTYQTNAMAVDMDVPRWQLAMFPNFRQFEVAAREAVRHFDLRIGPPWWNTDRDFLEMVYTTAKHQEEPDPETSMCVEGYWGEGAADTPYWQAQTFLDHEYAGSSNLVNMARYSIYGCDHENPVLQPGWTEEDAKATLLLNWQVIEQPRVALELPDCDEHLRIGTFPHRHELRRIVRSLSAKPRGRPQRSVPCPR